MMRDAITPKQLRELKQRKKASPDEQAAEKSDRALHSAACTALKAAGFDPKKGYILERHKDGYIAVPLGYRNHLEIRA